MLCKKHLSAFLLWFISVLSLSLNAQAFQFGPFVSSCGYSLTTTVEITGIRVGQIFNDASQTFKYELEYSYTNVITGALPPGSSYNYVQHNFFSSHGYVSSVYIAPNPTYGNYSASGFLSNNSPTYNGTQNLVSQFGLVSGNTYSMPGLLSAFNYTSANINFGSNGNGCWLSSSSTANASLPVSLTGFEGKFLSDYIHLRWTTASETNNKGFTIQHSIDAKNWETVGFISSNVSSGNSNTLQDYVFPTKSFEPGSNYYRLQQEDWDGASEYSNIISVDVKNDVRFVSDKISIYPNPVENVLSFDFSNAKSALAQVLIFDFSGKMVMSTQDIGNSINVSYISPGLYQVHVLMKNGDLHQTKLVKI